MTRTARPNVVMITADDASIGDLRWMPHTRRLLQQQGVTMTQAIAPTPLCVPARTSILTGQYADNNGTVTISGPRGGFHSFRDRNTLPVWLRNAGYSTMFTGKYLQGYGVGQRRHYVPPGWSDWRATTTGTYSFFNTAFNVNGRHRQPRGYSTDVITDYAVSMLKRQHRRPGKPFFLWANYVGPHAGGPVSADDPRRRWPRDPSAWIKTTSPAPRDVDRFRSLRLPRTPDLWRTAKPKSKFDGPHRRTSYRRATKEGFQQRIEALQSVDRGVARIVRRLRAQKDLARTYLIFASDNGFLTGQHNRGGKLIPFDRVLRIPMVIRGPGVPHGKRLSTTITNVDLPVSIAAVAGVRPGRRVDGVPVFHMLGKRAAHRPVPIAAWRVRNGARPPLYRGIRYRSFTYIHAGRRVEFYDRRTDPGELRNRIRSRQHAADVAMMKRLFRTYARCRGDSCPKSWG